MVLAITSLWAVARCLLSRPKYLVICVAMVGHGSYASEDTKPKLQGNSPPPWLIVQPEFAKGFVFDTAEGLSKGLQRELGYAVPIHGPTRGWGEKAMQWSLDAASTQASIVVVPEEGVLIGVDNQHRAAHVSNFEPLLVLAYKRWCAFTSRTSSLTSAHQLRDWVSMRTEPVRVAVPIMSGRTYLWVQGMAQQTKREWQAEEYGINGDFVQALSDGANIAIARCDRLGASRAQLRLLVHSGDPLDRERQDIPTFGEAGWLPFAHGWMAVFAPKHIDAGERERIAQAIYRVTRQDVMQNGLLAAGFIPANLPPQESRQHISGFYQSWSLIIKLLKTSRENEAQAVKQ